MEQITVDRLSRSLNTMPDDVKNALDEYYLWDAFRACTAYQQNDYLGWNKRAKRLDTVQKLLAQMLDELGQGG